MRSLHPGLLVQGSLHCVVSPSCHGIRWRPRPVCCVAVPMLLCSQSLGHRDVTLFLTLSGCETPCWCQEIFGSRIPCVVASSSASFVLRSAWSFPLCHLLEWRGCPALASAETRVLLGMFLYILKQCWGLCMYRPCLCTSQHILNESAGLLVESRSVQHLSSLPQPSILAKWSMETRSFQASWLPTESPLQAPICQTSSGLSRGVCVWMGVLAVCISDGVRGVLMSPDYAHIVLCVDQLVPLGQR